MNNFKWEEKSIKILRSSQEKRKKDINFYSLFSGADLRVFTRVLWWGVFSVSSAHFLLYGFQSLFLPLISLHFCLKGPFIHWTITNSDKCLNYLLQKLPISLSHTTNNYGNQTFYLGQNGINKKRQ